MFHDENVNLPGSGTARPGTSSATYPSSASTAP